MNTFRLLPLVVLGLAAGAQAAAPQTSPGAMASLPLAAATPASVPAALSHSPPASTAPPSSPPASPPASPPGATPGTHAAHAALSGTGGTGGTSGPVTRTAPPGYAEVEWIRTPRAQPHAAGAAAAASEAASSHALSAMRAEAASDWTVELSDQTFRQTLLRWTRIANWQLVWEADRDFAIDAQVTLHGNFLQALDQAMTSLRDTDYPVAARVNPDTRVVRVVRYLLDGERR